MSIVLATFSLTGAAFAASKPVVTPPAPPPPKVTLHAPVTFLVTSGDITLEGGVLSISPEGKSYQGGTITIGNGAVVFDPQPPPPPPDDKTKHR